MDILLRSFVPGSMKDQAFVDCGHVSDSHTTLGFRLTDIFPSTIGYGGMVFTISNTNPLEATNDGVNFFDERFGEKDRGHIVDENGG